VYRKEAFSEGWGCKIISLLWKLLLQITLLAGKVRYKFSKNCAIHKYFGTHVKNFAKAIWKDHNYFIKLYFCLFIPIYLTILKCQFLVKKIAQNIVIFSTGLTLYNNQLNHCIEINIDHITKIREYHLLFSLAFCNFFSYNIIFNVNVCFIHSSLWKQFKLRYRKLSFLPALSFTLQ